MLNVNRVFLLGRLVRDPALRTTGGGTSVVTMRLAINQRFKSKEEVVFVDVIVFGARGEACAKYLSRGREAFVEGRLTLAIWEADGQKRSILRVTAEKVIFLGQAGHAQEAEQPPTDPDGEPANEEMAV